MAVSPTPAQDVATGLGEAQQGDTNSGRTSAWIRKVPSVTGVAGEGALLRNVPLVTGDTAGHRVSRRQALQLRSCFSEEPEGGGGRWLPRPPGPCWPGWGTAGFVSSVRRGSLQRRGREFSLQRWSTSPVGHSAGGGGPWRCGQQSRSRDEGPCEARWGGALGRRIRDGGGTGARPPVVTAEVRPGWAETVLTGSPLRPEPPPGAGRLEAPGGPGDRVDLRPAGWAESPTRPRPRLPQGRPRVWRLLPG